MNIRDFIRDVLTLDVQDFSYLYTPRNLQITLSKLPELRKRGLRKRIAIFFGHTFQSIFMLRSYRPFPSNRVLFVCTTVNQRVALASIVNKMAEASWVNILQHETVNLPLLFAYLLALPFFPLVISKFLRAKGDQRTAFYYVFDRYWFAYGYYLLVRLLLRRNAPKAVVVANDHVIWFRAFVKAAQDENIPTIYLQHASVTDRFPPLSFDYAILDGTDALKKYASSGPSQTKVFLAGMPKFDEFVNFLNDNGKVHSIGICVNTLDNFQEVRTLCNYLTESFPELTFILRPHPGDSRNKIWKELANTYTWQLSNCNEESVFQFLQHVDAIIAGDSSIHLEAALLNVFPIYYVFGRLNTDYYGFFRNGLVDYCETPEMVQVRVHELLEHIPSVRSRSKFYNAVVGTKYDGHSTDLSSILIDQIARSLAPDLAGWERIIEVKQLQAYQPDNVVNLLRISQDQVVRHLSTGCRQ